MGPDTLGAYPRFRPNAQAALELLGPETGAAFKKNVTGNMWESLKKTFINFFAVTSIFPLKSSIRLYYSSKKLDTCAVRLRVMVQTPATLKRAPRDCNLVSLCNSSTTSSSVFLQIAYTWANLLLTFKTNMVLIDPSSCTSQMAPSPLQTLSLAPMAFIAVFANS